jgi:hypothetical protein
MPSTRRGCYHHYDAGSESDPDYYPSDDNSSVSAVEDSHDRCRYIQQYESELQVAFATLKDHGNRVMGPAFLQLCDFHTFANFCYKHTLPMSAPH